MKNYQDVLKKGDVLFTFRRGNWISKLIWWFSRKSEKDPKISHTVLYLGNNVVIDNSMLKGVKLGTIKHFNTTKYDVRVNRIDNLTSEEFVQLYKNSVEQVDQQKYSYMQLLLSLFKIIFRIKKIGDYSEKESICNEFVIDRFKEIGYDIFPDRDSADTTPIETYQAEIWTRVV